jgi:hypothetical protein
MSVGDKVVSFNIIADNNADATLQAGTTSAPAVVPVQLSRLL